MGAGLAIPVLALRTPTWLLFGDIPYAIKKIAGEHNWRSLNGTSVIIAETLATPSLAVYTGILLWCTSTPVAVRPGKMPIRQHAVHRLISVVIAVANGVLPAALLTHN